MDTREDSIPFSFTPDGLDETTIDALIGEAYVQVSDEPHDRPADLTTRRPARRRTNRRTAHNPAA